MTNKPHTTASMAITGVALVLLAPFPLVSGYQDILSGAESGIATIGFGAMLAASGFIIFYDNIGSGARYRNQCRLLYNSIRKRCRNE